MKIKISLSSLEKNQIAATHLSFGDKFILKGKQYVVVEKKTNLKDIEYKITRLSDYNPMYWKLPKYSHTFVILLPKYEDLTKEEVERIQKPFNALTDRKQQEMVNMTSHLARLGVQAGDIVLVRWFGNPFTPEVVMNILQNGKVKIKRRTDYRLEGVGHKYISAGSIVRIIEKGPDITTHLIQCTLNINLSKEENIHMKIRISTSRIHLMLFNTFEEALDKVIEISKQGDEASLMPKGNKWQVEITSK